MGNRRPGALSTGWTTVPPAHRRGTSGFRRATLAMFAAGLSTFMTLYCVQALLPSLAQQFSLSPATAALTVSIATAAMACAVIPLTALSDTWGRVPLMTVSLIGAGACGVVAAFAPDFGLLLVVRVLQGCFLAGVQATAVKYLTDEVEGTSLGAAVGLYVAGNGIGGMGGRLLASEVLTTAGTWQWAIGVVGAVSLLCGGVFVVLVPRAVRFETKPMRPRVIAEGVARAFRDSGMVRLYVLGFLTMSGMVTVYNYLGFRLLAAPFELSHGTVGLIFIVFIAGSAASMAAGRLVDRFGRRAVLTPCGIVSLIGLLVMLAGNIAVIVTGLAVFTAGIFATHAVGSNWTGSRGGALRAQGAAVYWSFTYLGSALVSYVGGFAYDSGGWPGVTAYIGTLEGVALLVGLTLWRLRPVADAAEAAETHEEPDTAVPADARPAPAADGGR